MAGTADIIDIATRRLGRNAMLSARQASRNHTVLNWLDMTTSSVCELFIAELPRRPRLVNDGEIWFTTTALHGTAHYLASEHFLYWNPLKQAAAESAPARPRPELKITVFDRNRERTAARASLQAV